MGYFTVIVGFVEGLGLGILAGVERGCVIKLEVMSYYNI